MEKDTLNQYLNLIGVTGKTPATLDTLSRITQSHSQTFAFENLNPLLRMPVDMGIESLVKKFFEAGRGGYCYEHNNLLLHVLKSVGYSVRGLLGKTYNPGVPIEKMRRTHMLLLVTVEGADYIADVGYGGLVPTVPIKFRMYEEQQTPLESFRITPERAHFNMQINRMGEWRSLYLFDLQEQYITDFEIGNWYTSTYPKVSFTNHLMVAIVGSDCRYTLNDNQFSTYYPERDTERITISDPDELSEILTTTFRINLRNLSGLKVKLASLIT